MRYFLAHPRLCQGRRLCLRHAGSETVHSLGHPSLQERIERGSSDRNVTNTFMTKAAIANTRILERTWSEQSWQTTFQSSNLGIEGIGSERDLENEDTALSVYDPTHSQELFTGRAGPTGLCRDCYEPPYWL